MIEVVHGALEDVLPYCDAEEFDAVLCDPPYGLSFMGKKWDYDVPSAALWAEILRTLKPGAPVLAFGGTRTYHRLVCGMEDGGLEIRDTIAWIYGSGFPKSQNISIALDKAQGLTRPVIGSKTLSGNACVPLKEKGGTYGVAVGTVPAQEVPVTGPASEIAEQWDGYGTALKPALEPVCVARKPLDGTMVQNVNAYGVGGLNIDGTRIDGDPRPVMVRTETVVSANAMSGVSTGATSSGEMTSLGRWPANVILDEDAGAMLDAQSGNRPGMSGGGKHKPDYPGGMFGGIDSTNTARGDKGGASRFFYCPKANRKEREAGCAELPTRAGFEAVEREEGSAGVENPRAGAGRTAGKVANFHPTVKPLDLCRYLATLILPPNVGKILIPWSGSGSEMIGAYLAGWRNIVGIEREEDYCKIARARIDYHSGCATVSR